MGPGHFDMNGNYIGDYEIKKVSRATKDSSYATGGRVDTDIRDSSIISPWF